MMEELGELLERAIEVEVRKSEEKQSKLGEIIDKVISNLDYKLNAIDKLLLIKEINEKILGIEGIDEIKDPKERELKIAEARKKLLQTGRQTLHPLLVGDSGVGKSTRVIQAFGFEKTRTIILTQMLPEDIGGLPKIDPQKNIVTFILPEDIINYKILFFDEIDKASTYKLAPILSILTEKRLRGYDLYDRFIVFGGQPDFLETLNQDATLRALGQRLIYIPCYYKEAQEYVEKIENISLTPETPHEKPKTETEDEYAKFEESVANFKLTYLSPRYKQYIVAFAKLVWEAITQNKKIEEMKEEDIPKVLINILTQVFYYVDTSFLIYIAKQVAKREIFVNIEPEIGKMLESHVYTLQRLPEIQAYMDALRFYSFLCCLYEVTSTEERKTFFQRLYDDIKTKLHFLKDEFPEIAIHHIGAVLLWLKDTDENAKTLYPTYYKYFPDESKNLATYMNRILKSWKIEKQITV
jgi:MoxR-like ATPase